jgi:hypothetical protein
MGNLHCKNDQVRPEPDFFKLLRSQEINSASLTDRSDNPIPILGS